jgi:hypothetical protein
MNPLLVRFLFVLTVAGVIWGGGGSVALAADAVITPGDTVGEQRLAVILVDLLQDGDETDPAAYAAAIFTEDNSLNEFYQEASYGQTWFTGNVFGWYDLEIACDATDAAIFAAADADIDFTAYDRYLIIYRRDPSCVGAFGSSSFGKINISTPDGIISASLSRVRYDDVYAPDYSGLTPGSTPVHELGHAFGIEAHANGYDCGSDAVSATTTGCRQLSEGDLFDLMGNRRYAVHPNACFKEKLGWFADGQVVTTESNGDYTLSPLEITDAEVKALRLPLVAPIPIPTVNGSALWMTDYYLEYRTPLVGVAKPSQLTLFGATSTQVLLRGVLRHTSGNGTCLTTYLIDTTPESALDWPWESGTVLASDATDPMLMEGDQFSDPFNFLTVETLALAAEAATVRLTFSGSKYWSGVGEDSSWSTLADNWWNDAAATRASTVLPQATNPVVVLGETAPVVDLDTWTPPASLDVGEAGIIFTSEAGATLELDVVGNAEFIGDEAEVSSAISGTKTRRYREDATPTRDLRGWIVVADGAVVDVTGATHDETTSFQEINGGRFVGHEETVEDPPADDREDDNNNSGGGGGGGGGKPRRPALTPVLVPPANLSIFTRDLSLGAAGADVRQLQIFLNNHGFLVVARGPGAPGAETDFFSASTRAALGRFQVAQGLVASSESVNFGVLDALTRQRLNSLVAATPVTDPQVLIQELRRQLLTLLQQLALLLSQRP